MDTIEERSESPVSETSEIEYNDDLDKMIENIENAITTTKLFQCDVCKKMVKNLIKHKRSHDRPKISCDECGKTFIKPETFDNHKKTHVLEKIHIPTEYDEKFNEVDLATREKLVQYKTECAVFDRKRKMIQSKARDEVQTIRKRVREEIKRLEPPSYHEYIKLKLERNALEKMKKASAQLKRLNLHPTLTPLD
jgi:hypothetical protein